ncbi:hypothetical protein [Virgibacillus oceani]|uniref:Uncharacterized protein n=1 Tax=Virgibacillus oceani TaxID=1479511 RepID=A0A917LZ69_9BACI|nr:hypothetical protein [Virgibacillus oceani]GGG67457.1 hypothetical protein GCM10011398_09030 [Virgibacillus oceani]
MGEQERYKKVLRKMIDETENFKIQSSEELIKALIHELKESSPLARNINIQSK